ncbi:MAG TPA: NmrA family NAD(P)-binding protein [Chthoniobacter sp.]|nr:NmrA family NAD(P)-binding protein [Chthoniobacter sp.]
MNTKQPIYAVTGATGNVGGTVARTLLAGGNRVRVVVRTPEKAEAWTARGCDAALADIADAAALSEAFANAAGVFVMIPPDFDPAPGFPLIHEKAAALRTALLTAQPGKVVLLTTIGAQVGRPNLLHSSQIVEETLGDLPMPLAFLRAGWFMENFAWDVAAAKTGAVPSYLQPLDHPIAMVATADIGETAATLLRETWTGLRIVELEGPQRYSANDVATGFAAALGHPVKMDPIPRVEWEARFRAQGIRHPEPRISMLDGFNEDWIEFQRSGTEHRLGTRNLNDVLLRLVGL